MPCSAAQDRRERSRVQQRCRSTPGGSHRRSQTAEAAHICICRRMPKDYVPQLHQHVFFFIEKLEGSRGLAVKRSAAERAQSLIRNPSRAADSPPKFDVNG